MNICGCLLHVLPTKAQDAAVEIAAVDGVEVHAQTEDGRFVVVVEDTAERQASETIMALHQIAGVISLTLTFHHFDDFDQSTATSSFDQNPSQAGARSHDDFRQPSDIP